MALPGPIAYAAAIVDKLAWIYYFLGAAANVLGWAHFNAQM